MVDSYPGVNNNSELQRWPWESWGFSLGFYWFSVGFCGVYEGILWESHATKEINKASNKTHP